MTILRGRHDEAAALAGVMEHAERGRPMTVPAARRFPQGSVTDPAHCLICHLDQAPDEAIVFRDGDWACEVAPGFEVPGWYFLRLRRHALGWAELKQPEAAAFGPVVQDLMGALDQAFGAPACYLMTFGEAYPHFHAVVTVRTEDIPPESRSGNILALLATRLDRDAALARVPAVRGALAAVREFAGRPEPADPPPPRTKRRQ
jgi:diadenosine tetraphosphate (Ap4A) HIT family hydrolase